MRRLVVPATLALLLAASGSVVAASQRAAAAKTAAVQLAPKAKEVECIRQWRAQKKHAQTRRTFLAACQKA
jgi:hypothetical protein